MNRDILLIVAFIIGAVNSLSGTFHAVHSSRHCGKREFCARNRRQFFGIFRPRQSSAPAAGGLLYALGADIVYYSAAFSVAVACVSTLFIIIKTRDVKREPVTLKLLLAGVTFIKNNPVVLGSISLDLFAVLFGGATALLPVYASTILMIGSVGLGILRAAPALGAFSCIVYSGPQADSSKSRHENVCSRHLVRVRNHMLCSFKIILSVLSGIDRSWRGRCCQRCYPLDLGTAWNAG